MPKKKTKPAEAPAAAPQRVRILKTVDARMRAYGGFVWPKSGPVSCPDWKPTHECGNGLHGLLEGFGNGLLRIWVDGGNGFQELQNIAIGSGIRDLKALAVSALVELRERIACGDVREGEQP